ncbi:hypothetical protein D3C75_568840 [compost metagenome]
MGLIPFVNADRPLQILRIPQQAIQTGSQNSGRRIGRGILVIRLILLPGHSSAEMIIPRRLNISPQLQCSGFVLLFTGSLERPQQRKRGPFHIIIIIVEKGPAIISTQTVAVFPDMPG